VAELRLMEVRDGAVIVGSDEIRDERPLAPTSGMEVRDGPVMAGIDETRDERPLTPPLERESVGSDDSVGRVFVMLASMDPGKVSPRLDDRPDREDGRLVSNVICESDVPVRLLISDAPGRRVLREPVRVVREPVRVVREPVRVVMEPRRVVREPGRVVIEPRGAEIEVRGFITNVVALTTGMLPGPIVTARLDTKTTVLVPLRRVPPDSAPCPVVKVQTPSVYANPEHVNSSEHWLEQSR
jgi:hypothetical protein